MTAAIVKLSHIWDQLDLGCTAEVMTLRCQLFKRHAVLSDSNICLHTTCCLFMSRTNCYLNAAEIICLDSQQSSEFALSGALFAVLSIRRLWLLKSNMYRICINIKPIGVIDWLQHRREDRLNLSYSIFWSLSQNSQSAAKTLLL